MARSVRDASLDTRTARSRLKARGKPYWRQLEPGLSIGYRKPLSGPGKWVVRHYLGGGDRYETDTFGDGRRLLGSRRHRHPQLLAGSGEGS